MQSLLTIILLVVGGITLVWVAKRLDLGLGEGSRIALIAAPVVLYLGLTGRLLEFEGLGLSAKFKVISSSAISSAAAAADLMYTSEAGNNPQSLAEWLLRPCRSYYKISQAMFADLTRPETKDAVEQMHAAIRSSILCGTFKALVIVDQDDRPLGLFKGAFIQDIIEIEPTYQPDLRSRIPAPPKIDATFNLIMATSLGAIFRAPGDMLTRDFAVHVAVRDYENVLKTYGKLTEAHADVGAIVDRLGRFEGIITREAIDTWVVEGLLSQGL